MEMLLLPQQADETFGGLKMRTLVQGMVLSGKQFMTGGALVMVMVCWQKFVSPQQSVIIQVRVVAYEQGLKLVTASLP